MPRPTCAEITARYRCASRESVTVTSSASPKYLSRIRERLSSTCVRSASPTSSCFPLTESCITAFLEFERGGLPPTQHALYPRRAQHRDAPSASQYTDLKG